MIRVRHITGNLPLIGRYLYPLYNKNCIFHKPGDYYPKGYLKSYESISKPRILVSGLPKSGNTWIVNLVSACLDLETIFLHQKSGGKGVGMLHDPFSMRMAKRNDLSRGVYIMRDMRDCIVSYYHYVQTDYYKELNDPFCSYPDWESFYYEYFLGKIVRRYSWHTHAEAYIKHGMPLVKYERLVDDPVQELQNLFNRWGVKVEESRITEAIEANNIKRLQKEGKEMWHNVPKTHFRKGGYGGYKEELPPAIIADINKRFGNYLERWGYSLDA